MTLEEAKLLYGVRVDTLKDTTKWEDVFTSLLNFKDRFNALESKIDSVKDYCQETSGEYWAVNILDILED